MSHEPLYRIGIKVRKMPVSERCAYLIACIRCERDGSDRKRKLEHMLTRARTDQIAEEVKMVPKREPENDGTIFS